MRKYQSFFSSVFRNQCKTTGYCIGRIFDFNFFTFQFNTSTYSLSKTKQSFHDFRSAGSHQTGQTKNLAGFDAKVDIIDFVINF